MLPDPTPSQWGLNLGIWFQNSGVCAEPREPIKLVKGEMLLTGLGFWGDLGPLLAATQAGLAQAERAGLWTGQAEPGERPGGRGRGMPWGRWGKRAVPDPRVTWAYGVLRALKPSGEQLPRQTWLPRLHHGNHPQDCLSRHQL